MLTEKVVPLSHSFKLQEMTLYFPFQVFNTLTTTRHLFPPSSPPSTLLTPSPSVITTVSSTIEARELERAKPFPLWDLNSTRFIFFYSFSRGSRTLIRHETDERRRKASYTQWWRLGQGWRRGEGGRGREPSLTGHCHTQL